MAKAMVMFIITPNQLTKPPLIKKKAILQSQSYTPYSFSLSYFNSCFFFPFFYLSFAFFFPITSYSHGVRGF